MSQFFNQEARTEIPSIDESQTRAVIDAVNANHQRYLEKQRSRAQVEVPAPRSPSFLRRNMGNIAGLSFLVAGTFGLVELGLGAADHQATKAAQTNEEMVQQQQMLDNQQPLPYEVAP
jgi:hypothetical protein